MLRRPAPFVQGTEVRNYTWHVGSYTKSSIQRRESLRDKGRQVSEMKYLLGIDVGTTGTKSLLFSEEGTLVGSAYRSYVRI